MPPLPRRADVVVIGAGFAGASAAYNLALEGVRDVLVLDKEATVGYHASGRNAAQCRSIVEDEVVTELTIRGAAFLRQPPAGFSDKPLLRPCGGILLSSRQETLEDLAFRAQRREIPHERVDMDWVLRRWARLAGLPAAGGVFFPTDGVIDVHALLQGFLGGARARGARVELTCPVQRFKKTRVPGQVLVETEHGSVETSCVINAAGAWAGEVGKRAGSSDTLFAPIHRHLHYTEHIPKLDPSLPFVWYLDGADEFYVRPEGNGLLLSGCDATEVAPSDARVLPNAAENLAEKLGRLTPWLADLRITRTWACLRTFTPDQRPVIGWDRKVPWLFWVAGLGGTGATSAPAVGQVAASEVMRRMLG